MEQHAVIKFSVDELTHVVRISAIEGVREIESMVKVPWGRGKKCTMLDATILHIDRFAECRRFQDAYDEMMNAAEQVNEEREQEKSTDVPAAKRQNVPKKKKELPATTKHQKNKTGTKEKPRKANKQPTTKKQPKKAVMKKMATVLGSFPSAPMDVDSWMTSLVHADPTATARRSRGFDKEHCVSYLS